MIPVNGKPFISYILDQLTGTRIKDITFCVGHEWKQVVDYVESIKPKGIGIHFSLEEDPLGTAGAIKRAENLIFSDPFIVMNGDSYCGIQINRLFSYYPLRDEPTMVVTKVDNTFGKGRVDERNGWIPHFWIQDEGGPGYVNAGIYVLRKPHLGILPMKGSFERDVLTTKSFSKVHAYVTTKSVVDIGTPEGLKEAEDIL